MWPVADVVAARVQRVWTTELLLMFSFSSSSSSSSSSTSSRFVLFQFVFTPGGESSEEIEPVLSRSV